VPKAAPQQDERCDKRAEQLGVYFFTGILKYEDLKYLPKGD
jgi:hypothetical protein